MTWSSRVSIGLVVLACLPAGCTDDGRNSPSDDTAAGAPSSPCSRPASELHLGSATQSRPPAEFTTDGSPFYLTVSGFEHTQLQDPKVGVSSIYVGHVEQPPTYDAQRATVTNVVKEILGREDQPAELQLEPGRYWLWASHAPEITISGCTPTAVTDARPGSA